MDDAEKALYPAVLSDAETEEIRLGNPNEMLHSLRPERRRFFRGVYHPQFDNWS